MERSTFIALAALVCAAPLSAAAEAGTDAVIAGHLRYADGSPAAGIEVWQYRDNVGWYEITAADGSYTYEGGPGTYVTCAGGFDSATIEQCWDHIDQVVGTGRNATPVTVEAGETRDGIDFDLSRGGSISGRVVDAFAGTPIANRWVTVNLSDLVHTWPGQTYAYTDADGNYRVEGVPAGAWYVHVEVGGALVGQIWPGVECSELTCDFASAQPLEVGDEEDITGIDFELSPDVLIRGRVTDAASGQGLPGIEVNTYWIFELPFGSAVYTMTSASTDANGDYALYGFGVLESAETVYYVGTLGSAPHIDTAYPNVPFYDIHAVSNGTAFAFRHDTEVDGIDLALPLGAAISGTVRDAHTGATIADAYVSLFGADGNVMANVYTSAEGTYTTPAWYADTYYLDAGSSRGGCVVWLERPCPTGGFFDVDPTPLVLSAGELRTGIDFALDTEYILQSSFELDEPGITPAAPDRRNP